MDEAWLVKERASEARVNSIMESMTIELVRKFIEDNQAFVDMLNTSGSMLKVFTLIYQWAVQSLGIEPLESIKDEMAKARISSTAREWCKGDSNRQLKMFYKANYVLWIFCNKVN